jgi:hypothetical protein
LSRASSRLHIFDFEFPTTREIIKGISSGTRRDVYSVGYFPSSPRFVSVTYFYLGEGKLNLPRGKPLKNQEAVIIFKTMEVVSRSSLGNEPMKKKRA